MYISNSFVLICTILFLSIFPVTTNCEELSEFEINARDFSFEDIKFGMSRKDVGKSHKEFDLLKEECDKNINHYVVIYKSKFATKVVCCYFNDKLYQMRIIYEDKEQKKLGGQEVVLDKIVGKFGRCHESSGVETAGNVDERVRLTWDFSSVSREIVLIGRNDYIRIDIHDSEIEDEVNEKKKSVTDTGF